MSFFWGRFDPILGLIDPEVKNLYRIRDNDKEYSKGFLVDESSGRGRFIDNQGSQDMITELTAVNTDPIWETMTEHERIENGLKSKLQFRTLNFYCLQLSTFLFCKY